MRKNAFICCTPYHLILSLHLSKTIYKNYINDIFICDHFKGAQSIYSRLKKEKLFSTVYYIQDKEFSYPKKNQLVRNYFKQKEIFNSLYSKDKNSKYQNLTIFTFNYFSKIFYKIQKSYPNSTVSLVEDGIGTYINALKAKEKVRSVLSRFNKNILSFTSVDFIFLLDTELQVGLKQEKLREIPKVCFEQKEIDFLNRLFDYLPNNDYKDKKIILIDQPFNKPKQKIVRTKVFNILEKIFGKHFIIKMHPRDDISLENINKKQIDKRGIPFELILLNNCLSNNSILVTYNSTAVLTPKLIGDFDNEIIILNRIIGQKNKYLGKIFNNSCFNIKIISEFKDVKDFFEKKV